MFFLITFLMLFFPQHSLAAAKSNCKKTFKNQEQSHHNEQLKQKTRNREWADEKNVPKTLKQKNITTTTEFIKQRPTDQELQNIPLPNEFQRIYGKSWNEILGRKKKHRSTQQVIEFGQ